MSYVLFSAFCIVTGIGLVIYGVFGARTEKNYAAKSMPQMQSSKPSTVQYLQNK